MQIFMLRGEGSITPQGLQFLSQSMAALTARSPYHAAAEHSKPRSWSFSIGAEEQLAQQVTLPRHKMTRRYTQACLSA
jgi:hypothetical protein